MKVGIIILEMLAASILIGNATAQNTDFPLQGHEPSYRNVITVDDDGDGDYTDFAQAVNSAQDGDVIEVYSGVYTTTGDLYIDKELHIKGIPHELGGGNSSGRPIINLFTGSHSFMIGNYSHSNLGNVIVEGLELCGSEDYSDPDPVLALGMSTMFGAHDIIIRDNVFRNFWNGFAEVWSQRILVEDNTFIDCKHGVYLYNRLNIVRNNRMIVTNPDVTQILPHDASGIILGILLPPALYADSNIIWKNIITGYEGEGSQAIYVEYGNSNTINGNLAYGNYRGIYIRYGSDNSVYENNLDNQINAYDGVGSTFMRNYWSDYSGTDANGDGIGDTPYDNNGAYDPKPMMNLRVSCGDANYDGSVNLADAVFLINFIFNGGPEPIPVCSADANGDGVINVADPVYLVNFIFGGGPQPVKPCCE